MCTGGSQKCIDGSHGVKYSALVNLEKVGNHVDYIITHTAPSETVYYSDYIRFAAITDEERMVLVEIVDIFTAPSFVALEQKLQEIGLLAKESFSPIGMRKYYSVEDEEKYGVVGIRIRVISSVSTEP